MKKHTKTQEHTFCLDCLYRKGCKKNPDNCKSDPLAEEVYFKHYDNTYNIDENVRKRLINDEYTAAG